MTIRAVSPDHSNPGQRPGLNGSAFDHRAPCKGKSSLTALSGRYPIPGIPFFRGVAPGNYNPGLQPGKQPASKNIQAAYPSHIHRTNTPESLTTYHQKA